MDTTTAPNEVSPELLQRDAALPPDLAPNQVASRSPDVFLTGAAGFVGSAILWKLLQHSSARVFCHLRARSVDDAHARLMQSLCTLGLDPRPWRARVIPVLGDLGRPRLGMTDAQWSEVAARTGAIFHVGALVNHVAPYPLFRRPNVEAAREILRLSSASAQKAVHHISSLGYWSGYRGEACESARNLDGPGVRAPGYLLSKWVSDRLMEQASDRGFPVAIYRLGYVSGGWHGGSNLRGWMELHLRAFARLRQMPQGESCLAVTPLDLLASDLWTLSETRDACGRAFHLAHREQPITLHDVECAFAGIGMPVQRVSPAEWYAAFQAAPHDSYMQLLEVFLSESPPEWSAEQHAFAQRISAATAARLGNPAPFAKVAYLQSMLRSFVKAESARHAPSLQPGDSFAPPVHPPVAAPATQLAS